MAERIHPVVIKLFKALLLCSQTQSKELRIKLAACLGDLGAIDPGRLDLDVKSKLHVCLHV